MCLCGNLDETNFSFFKFSVAIAVDIRDYFVLVSGEQHGG